ncbi:MAG: contractile injection system protein, VgrG/Pvc8 family [Verrucomicrobiota bacterium]|nr:contractile injection system protein, VgrG/Pvc8 family [Verrucomicrobiota bacterium]
MTPKFRIEVEGVDITDTIGKRLISLVVRDEAGFASDTCEINLDDRGLDVAIPPKGRKLKVWMGYQESGLFLKGEFVVDECRHHGPPATLVISAKGADMLESLKTRKTRSWHEQTIGEIVTTIASEHGLDARIAAIYADTLIKHIDQSDESDLSFLTRLASERDAIAKPVSGKLLFVPRGEAKTAAGEALPTLSLKVTDFQKWEHTQQERENYKKVLAYWTDKRTGIRKEVTAGEDAPVKNLRNDYADEVTAQKAADAELRRIRRGKATLNLTLEGLPEAGADWRVTISDFKPEIDGLWSVHHAEHTYDESGLVTILETEIPQSE